MLANFIYNSINCSWTHINYTVNIYFYQPTTTNKKKLRHLKNLCMKSKNGSLISSD